MPKWTYKIISLQTGIIFQDKALGNWNTEFNKLGKDGWELVAVIPMHAQMGLAGSTPQVRAFFKRLVK